MVRGEDNYYRGDLDDIRIYNIVLSDSQIQQLYNDSIPTPTPTATATPTPTPTVTPTPTPTPTPVTLTVTKQGTGDGIITTSTGSLNCSGNIGTALYALNTQVIATVVTDNASTFNGWTGCDVTIGNQCTVNMTATRGITADFNGVCKKDFDDDGKTDILWQSKDTGDVYAWLMDGTVINSGGYADQGVPSDWSIY
ncbi:MAG: hypothetical protein SFH39_03345 [Candidatus Magnetobacterium sp. LHC-1]|uniref:Bacterial repeat domain-containing protein n=1 Tax=Candidatus Magnetobacterium casense TaxID=1455061 RepID=A0ABS6S126_9BACT|nr:hypothetical protein [Candidatus Magnetobacterium casensis]MBF0609419.1 hypothetical protein [Nitrospirota bacterium]MBV6342552.1 hypothetical protein [Candidatus Magnetobacterium casensis]